MPTSHHTPCSEQRQSQRHSLSTPVDLGVDPSNTRVEFGPVLREMSAPSVDLGHLTLKVRLALRHAHPPHLTLHTRSSTEQQDDGTLKPQSDTRAMD